MTRWEVAPTTTTRSAGSPATAEWLRPTPPGTLNPIGPTGKRFVLDNPELRFVVIRRILERIAQ